MLSPPPRGSKKSFSLEPEMAEPMLCAIMEQEDMVLSSRQMSRKIAPTIKKPFLWRITNAPACCAFSLTVLAALPVFFAVLAVFPAA